MKLVINMLLFVALLSTTGCALSYKGPSTVDVKLTNESDTPSVKEQP